MIATPQDVATLISPAAGPLHDALRIGHDFADQTMLDTDAAFHSHCVRYRAKMALSAHDSPEWSLTPGVSNSGIHLRLGGLHQARLLRSLNGTTPHPGESQARRAAWSNPEQLVLALDDTRNLAPMSLLLDWHFVDDEPVVHISLPKRPWKFGRSPQLHWRARLLDTGSNLDALEFKGDHEAQIDVSIDIDPNEFGTEVG